MIMIMTVHNHKKNANDDNNNQDVDDDNTDNTNDINRSDVTTTTKNDDKGKEFMTMANTSTIISGILTMLINIK